MSQIILVLAAAMGGFAIHAITMKVSFKQRTIDNKIKVYDALIGTWVKMRNYIYAHHSAEPMSSLTPDVAKEFDQMYGSSQQLIGEAILVCEDDNLTTDINELTERLYRTDWHLLGLDEGNAQMEEIKVGALAIAARMREDIKGNTRFEWRDLEHAVSGFLPRQFGRKKK